MTRPPFLVLHREVIEMTGKHEGGRETRPQTDVALARRRAEDRPTLGKHGFVNRERYEEPLVPPSNVHPVFAQALRPFAPDGKAA